METSEHQDKPDDAGSDADRLSGVRDFVRDAWIQALVAVGASEDEVQKILGKLGGWVEVGPDEARRLAADLSERLRRERGELEKSIESAVQRALGPFRLPNRDQVAEMDARIDQLSERVERLLENRRQS